MRIGVVKGMIVSTQKSENLVGTKLLIVEEIDSTGKKSGKDEVAVDLFGAGIGETVLLCHGSPARAILSNPAAPVDLVVVGIIDSIETASGSTKTGKGQL
ncbi:MAG: EutN/CcmL family microcompartment protein [Spirochaetaceae bacterium]|jgi:microcompartment protein CcmK/EutM|nr:EutN/CcmL family microcompartment protein [Spirochaetaceae bacterium]